MFEFHGWAVLRSTPGSRDQGSDGEGDDRAARRVQSLVDEVEDVASPGGRISLQQVNGEWQVWLHGLRNHRRAEVTVLFERIAATAPGSFGLLHIYDDEADDDNSWTC